MGDRRNIVLMYGDGNQICLYTHWEGAGLPEVLAKALERGRSRWSDERYLARIIFSEMIQNEVMGTLEYGIAPYVAIDESEQDIRVDLHGRMVGLPGIDEVAISFEEYVREFQ